MPNLLINKNSATGLQFESPPRYSLWGIHQAPWKKLLLISACLLMLAGLLSAAMQLLKNQRELQLLSSQQDALHQKIVNHVTKQQKSESKTVNLTPVQTRAYNTVISQLNTPWQHLFTDLERMTPQDIALIHIEPDGQRSTVKLQAEAKTLASLLTYATNLQQQGIFGHITYSKHETNEQDPNKPIRFSFELALNKPELGSAPLTGMQNTSPTVITTLSARKKATNSASMETKP